MGSAIGYLSNHRDTLRLCVDDGAIPIDYSDTEQLMKQVAPGRENWMFAGNLAAGARSADLMTLVSSAIRNTLGVWQCTKEVLIHLLSGTTGYASLRSDAGAAAHPDPIREYRRKERRGRAERKQCRRLIRRQANRRSLSEPRPT